MQKYQIIGACVKMQKISWEDEMKLIQGSSYVIDFERDFSIMYSNRQSIMNIVQSLDTSETQIAVFDVTNPIHYTARNHQAHQEFFEFVDKFIEKEKKCEKKWKKDKKKRKEYTKRLFKEIESGKYFLKERRK